MSNLLLVLGTAFIVGGIRYPVQTFNVQGSSVYSTLLMLAALAILLPSTLRFTSTEAKPGSL
jgi:Ca2+:H+ antiporter